jgi:Amt family ammonium transporter
MLKILMIMFFFTISLFAGEPVLDKGDTSFMLISTALVVFMAPVGLSLFYSGMTKSKNIVNSFLMVFMGFFISFIAWIIIGYSIAFGIADESLNKYIGGFSYILLNGISWEELANVKLGQLYPKLIFILFQGSFAGITVAIIAGSIVERMKFSTWMIFSFLWTILVYAPIAHIVWGGGFLFDLGTLDFAGGTVIHMTGGLAGLILAILIGKRLENYSEEYKPSSVIFTSTGAGLLLLGWFGFNGGSSFGANGITGLAYTTTIIAASIGSISWSIMEYMKYNKITLLGASSGLVSGLVAITPASGFVSVGGSLLIGIGGTFVAFIAVKILKEKFKYDDSLDAFGIHFIAGAFGALSTGILALNDKNLLWDGPLKSHDDRIGQIIVQGESILIVSIIIIVGTLISYYISKLLSGGARVELNIEKEGLDKKLHGEIGFSIDKSL